MTPEEVEEALDAFGAPYVVKDDGLAAGKGVVVTDDLEAARAHANACDRVVIEEFLDGPEVSLFAITDGTTVVPLQPAQDFKRALDGDEGPNTGGMGAYSPLPWADPKLVEEVMETVLQPTVDEMRRRGTPFSGLLYAGLAITSRGVRVIEFNARFGDPETQVVLARLQTPLAGVLLASANGTLADLEPLRWSEKAAVTVVVASYNYPDTPRTGDPITGLDEVAAEDAPHAYVLHAGDPARGRRGGERGRPCAVRHSDRIRPHRGPRARLHGCRPHRSGRFAAPHGHRGEGGRRGIAHGPHSSTGPRTPYGIRGFVLLRPGPSTCGFLYGTGNPSGVCRHPPFPRAIPSGDRCRIRLTRAGAPTRVRRRHSGTWPTGIAMSAAGATVGE